MNEFFVRFFVTLFLLTIIGWLCTTFLLWDWGWIHLKGWTTGDRGLLLSVFGVLVYLAAGAGFYGSWTISMFDKPKSNH